MSEEEIGGTEEVTETTVTEEPSGEAEESTVESEGEGNEGEGSEGAEFREFANPEDEARFKRVYGHMKQNERVIDQMGKDNKALLDRIDGLETKTEQRETSSRLDTLKAEKREALETGDTERVMELDDQIFDLKVETASKPKEQEEVEERPAWFTPERETLIGNWALETDANGQMLRPWAHPDHPHHNRTVATAEAVIRDTLNDGLSDQQILAEVDKLMGIAAPQPRRSAGPVLSGSGDTRASKKGKIALSEEQKMIARKMNMSEDKYAAAIGKWS